jgi:uncharacterized protein (DUF983 family)
MSMKAFVSLLRPESSVPDFMVSPFDRTPTKPDGLPAEEIGTPLKSPALPSSGLEAMARGARGRCPRCKEAKLFLRFLKPAACCPRCGQDWSHQQADDFPAYVSILITGHLMAPLIIALVRDAGLSVTALVAILVPLAMVLMIGLLQPAKGAIIALQWWFGMHGFKKERPGAIDVETGS